MPRSLIPRLLLCSVFMIPALVVRFGGIHTTPLIGVLIFGAAVVASAFMLSWAAEAAHRDITSGLAIALLAIITVLPEYAVDLYLTFTAGSDPSYIPLAAANMTGSNRLLLGLGWPVVVFAALWAYRKHQLRPASVLKLDCDHRLELGFLLWAGILALLIPLMSEIHLAMGIVLIAVFVFYLRQAGQGELEEEELVGTAETIGNLPTTKRRVLLIVMAIVAAAVILASAEPFADSLIVTGKQLGFDEYLLIQWLAPLASEAPEFIVAITFALRGKGAAAIGILLSAKVNQWTALVGSLPIAYLIGGGDTALPLDARQVEEFWLTATQTLMGIGILLALRFPRWGAVSLLGLFLIQFAFTSTTSRLLISVLYAAIALVTFIYHRRYIAATLMAPLRRPEQIAAHEPQKRPSADG